MLALTGAACVFAQGRNSGLVFWMYSITGLGLALLGSLAWSLENAPGKWFLIVATMLAAAGALVCLDAADPVTTASPLHTALTDLTSAAVLGTALSAMLMATRIWSLRRCRYGL